MKRRGLGARRLIVALDFTSLAPAVRMARQLRGLVSTVKIGSALFTACGPIVIQRMRALGFDVMLDLKFFDIPSTVELSCRAAVRHRVACLTVHAAGEPAMLAAAARGARAEAARLRRKRPLVLGVTVLTSVGSGRSAALTRRVATLARRALDAGCDGVVASAHEAVMLRRRFGRRLQIVCPGIRPACPATERWRGAGRPACRAGPVCRAEPGTGRRGAGRPACRAKFESDARGAGRPASAHAADQHRVCTPADAITRGADWLVIGRPVTGAPRPREAVWQILGEMEERS